MPTDVEHQNKSLEQIKWANLSATRHQIGSSIQSRIPNPTASRCIFCLALKINVIFGVIVVGVNSILPCFWEVRMSQNKTPRNDSRRMFLQLSVAAAAASAFRIVNEPLLAAAAIDGDRNQFPPGAVVINANENPLGPCDAARAAVVSMAPQGGRYSYWLTDELVDTFAEQQDLKREFIRPFPGSSEPLHFSVLSFTSPTRSYVTADPGYEAGMEAAKISGARIVKTPLTKT